MRTLNHIIASLLLLLTIACGSEGGPTGTLTSDGPHGGSEESGGLLSAPGPGDGRFMLGAAGGAADGNAIEQLAGAGGDDGAAGAGTAGVGGDTGGSGGSGGETVEGDAGTSDLPPDDSGPPDADAGQDAGQADAGPADAGEPDAEPEVDCWQDSDCDDGNECTADTCVDHECIYGDEETEGNECSAAAGTCRSGVCCTGCWDSVLGCIDDNPTQNDVACGLRGSNCRTCVDMTNVPICVFGQCCSEDLTSCSPPRWD